VIVSFVVITLVTGSFCSLIKKNVGQRDVQLASLGISRRFIRQMAVFVQTLGHCE